MNAGAGPDDAAGDAGGSRRNQPRIEIGTEGERVVRAGRRAGDRAVRIVRPRLEGFRVSAPGYIVVEQEPPPKGAASRAWRTLKRLLIGAPIATAQQAHERITKVKALAVFSSDALSSVAYATEAILTVLILAGLNGKVYLLPIGAVITLLLAIVATSYQQTIHAYPNGGGSYIVSKDNLGTLPGLIAGGALLIDYVLTVAVSVSAGVSAITSAFEGLHRYQVEICLICIAIIVVLNLRGIRESASIFAVPTYLFIASMLFMIAVGIVKYLFHALPVEALPVGPIHVPESSSFVDFSHPNTWRDISAFFVLNAFAQGCSAMTGVEAISNGVPAFKPPESHNAARTLVWMAVLLGTMFVGVTLLAFWTNVIPSEDQTILSKIGHDVFGGGPVGDFLYQFLQWTTFLILVLAANTSFADFPRLSSIMAKDKFLATQFAFRGDRLAFTNGIIVLGLLSALLVIRYNGSEQAMIPLYAVGVFLSFTLSQAGMVRHWWRQRGPNWRRSMVINGVGAVTTAVVLAVIVSSKFERGAWMIVLLIPILVGVFMLIERHYRKVNDQLVVSGEELHDLVDMEPERLRHTVLIPVAKVDRAALRAISYARSLTGQVDHPGDEAHAHIVAVHVTDDLEEGEQLKEQWDKASIGVPLVILESPYRSLVGPLMTYINALERQSPDGTSVVTVLLPEFIPSHWWENALHTHTALRLKGSLLFRPRTAVTSVPYHLQT